MFLNNKLFIVFYIVNSAIFSQENNSKLLDTIGSIRLNEVVITGQYNPQSVKKSIFDLKDLLNYLLHVVQFHLY